MIRKSDARFILSRLSCVYLLIILGCARSNNSKHDLVGYMGIKWNISSERLRPKVIPSSGECGEMRVDGEFHLSVPGNLAIPTYKVTYVFYQNGEHLNRVDIFSPHRMTKGKLAQDSSVFRKELIEKYGQPTLVKTENADIGTFYFSIWEFTTTRIELDSFEYTDSDSGRFMIRYSPRNQEIRQDIRKYLKPEYGKQ